MQFTKQYIQGVNCQHKVRTAEIEKYRSVAIKIY